MIVRTCWFLLLALLTLQTAIGDDASPGKGKDMTLLIVGDSLTHASAYPNEIARLLALPGNPRWTMIGTHKPAGVAAGVVHEGYSCPLGVGPLTG